VCSSDLEELISGNHEQIRSWRRRRALEKTARNRPDLLDQAKLTAKEQDFVESLKRPEIKAR